MRAKEKEGILSNIDWILVGIYLALVLFGWINIYSSAFQENHSSIFDFSQNYGKQFYWILAAAVLAIFILIIDVKFFPTTSYFIYAVSVLLLLLVLVIGTEIAGAKSWIKFGGFSLQPSEIAKFGTALAFAKYGSHIDFSLKEKRNFMASMAIIALPLMLVLLQNDTGSAIVFLSFSLVLFREGLSVWFLYIALAFITLFVATLYLGKLTMLYVLGGLAFFVILFSIKKPKSILKRISTVLVAAAFVFVVDYAYQHILEPYQQDRIQVLLGKKSDPRGIGYNIYQSKIAIGSGRLIGKGFLNGTQTKFKFVPEQSTDFIFCTVGEEWGFLGTSVIILLYLGLLFRIIYLAEKQRSPFSRIYGYSIACILFFHFFINIGMTIGLLPVIGIPLPFMSYGGSSLWSFTIMLFIFVKLNTAKYDVL